MDDWKSPFDANGDPDVVVGLEGYPPTGIITYKAFYEWEWPQVYEWSMDLTTCGSNTIFLFQVLLTIRPVRMGMKMMTSQIKIQIR